MNKVALVGAGGKMGMRLTKNLRDASQYEMSYLEVSEAGIEQLKKINISVSEEDKVIPEADIVILAVPDIILGKVSEKIVPKMKKGSMVYTLDPACALAGKLLHRDDLTYFIAHPSHPSVFNWEPTPEAQKDYFGGTLAKQTVVCALFKGDENEYQKGEDLAKTMYAPIKEAFKITAEQMGILEPALVETLCSTLQVIVREALVIKEALDWRRFSDWLSAFLHARGEDVLRVKGMLNVAGDSARSAGRCCGKRCTGKSCKGIPSGTFEHSIGCAV